jgi:hypothetical protein
MDCSKEAARRLISADDAARRGAGGVDLVVMK